MEEGKLPSSASSSLHGSGLTTNIYLLHKGNIVRIQNMSTFLPKYIFPNLSPRENQLRKIFTYVFIFFTCRMIQEIFDLSKSFARFKQSLFLFLGLINNVGT